MKPSELYATFRREMSDEEATFLWSDDDVYGYIDDAQKMFCRLTDGISDASSVDITQLPIAIGDEWLALSPLILKIRTSYLVSTGAPLEVINQEDMPRLGLRFDGRTGPVARLIVGMEEDRARCYPIAAVADTVQLSVFRLPLATITLATATGSTDVFEIHEQHHRHLLLWCQHLAYLKQDAETIDKTRSSDLEARFRAYCAAAKHEQQMKRHKVRTVGYGGI